MSFEQLPLDVWQLIINLNDCLEDDDIWSIEQVCKVFKKLSRNRTSLIFEQQPWSSISRFTNLRVANGTITDCCETTFQSKLIDFTIAIDCQSNWNVADWLVKYPKQRVQVDSVTIDNFSQQLYCWTPESLTMRWIVSSKGIMELILKAYRGVHKGHLKCHLIRTPSFKYERGPDMIKELDIEKFASDLKKFKPMFDRIVISK